ncbi:hypothetical protein J6590_011155 [Homalodisca vitripennis]|nr:hypothetical protein J6590_011155 [Homalodisca vitripennis]
MVPNFIRPVKQSADLVSYHNTPYCVRVSYDDSLMSPYDTVMASLHAPLSMATVISWKRRYGNGNLLERFTNSVQSYKLTFLGDMGSIPA